MLVNLIIGGIALKKALDNKRQFEIDSTIEDFEKASGKDKFSTEGYSDAEFRTI